MESEDGSSGDSCFHKFVKLCRRVTGEDEEVLSLLRVRYRQASREYVNSASFFDLVKQITFKIENSPSNKYVFIKEFVSALRAAGKTQELPGKRKAGSNIDCFPDGKRSKAEVSLVSRAGDSDTNCGNQAVKANQVEQGNSRKNSQKANGIQKAGSDDGVASGSFSSVPCQVFERCAAERAAPEKFSPLLNPFVQAADSTTRMGESGSESERDSETNRASSVGFVEAGQLRTEASNGAVAAGKVEKTFKSFVETSLQTAHSTTMASALRLKDNKESELKKPSLPSSVNHFIAQAEGKETERAGKGKETERAGQGKDLERAGQGKEMERAGQGKEMERAGKGKETERAGQGKETETAGKGKETEMAGKGKETETAGKGKETERAGQGKETERAGQGKETERAGQGKEVESEGHAAPLWVEGEESAGSSTSTVYGPSRREKAAKKKHIQRLEMLMKKLSDSIQKLEEREVDLSDLESEDNAYLLLDKYKKKFMKVWDKLCELQGFDKTTGRVTEKRFHFNGTRYPEINKKIQKFVNTFPVFPDYQDIHKVVQLCNRKHHLRLGQKMIEELARDIFVQVGNELQEIRHTDFVANFGSHLTDHVRDRNDPALYDPSLRRKLETNRSTAKNRLDEVFAKYICMQEEGKVGQASEEEEEEEEEDNQEMEEVGVVGAVKPFPEVSKWQPHQWPKKRKEAAKEREGLQGSVSKQAKPASVCNTVIPATQSTPHCDQKPYDDTVTTDSLQMSCSDAASDSTEDEIQVTEPLCRPEDAEVMDDSNGGPTGLSLNLILPQSASDSLVEERASLEQSGGVQASVLSQHAASCRGAPMGHLKEGALPGGSTDGPQPWTEQKGFEGSQKSAATAKSCSARPLMQHASEAEDYCPFIMEAETPAETISDTDSDSLLNDGKGTGDSDAIEVILVKESTKDANALGDAGAIFPKQKHSETTKGDKVVSLDDCASEGSDSDRGARQMESLEIALPKASESGNQELISGSANCPVASTGQSGVHECPANRSDSSPTSTSSSPKEHQCDAAETIASEESEVLKKAPAPDTNTPCTASSTLDESGSTEGSLTLEAVVPSSASMPRTPSKVTFSTAVEVITLTDSPAKPSGSEVEECGPLSTEDIVRSMCRKVIAGDNNEFKGFVAEGVKALMLAQDSVCFSSHSPRLLEEGKGMSSQDMNGTDVNAIIEIDDDDEEDGGTRKEPTGKEGDCFVPARLNGVQNQSVAASTGAVSLSADAESGLGKQVADPSEPPLNLSLQISSYRSLSENIVHIVSSSETSRGARSPSPSCVSHRDIPSNSLQPKRTVSCGSSAGARTTLPGCSILQRRSGSYSCLVKSKGKTSESNVSSKAHSGCSQSSMADGGVIVLSDSDDDS